MIRLRKGLGARLAGALLVVDGVMVAIGVMNLSSQAALHDRVSAVGTRDLVPLSHLRDMQNMDHTMVITNFAAQQSTDPAVRKGLLDLMPGYQATLLDAMEKLKRTTPAEMQGGTTSLIDSYHRMIEADKAFRADPSGPGAKERADQATALYLATEKEFGSLAASFLADAQKQREAVDSAYRTSQLRTIALLVLGVGIGLVLAARLALSVRRRTSVVMHALGRMAEGDLSSSPVVTGHDEIAEMARALDTGLGTLRTAFGEVENSATTLAAAASGLTGSAEANARAVQQSADAIQQVAGSAEVVARTVDGAATSTAELSGSIRDISDNAQQAARVAGRAVGVVETTNETVSQLGNSSQEIGNVIQVIQNIAAQTSLLALNATIEAARAGEAGRGFAVVAGEVKDLARETAEATDSVIERVQAIQADTEGAVRAIGEIGEIIEQINAYQSTIAAAVEEQSATTEALSASIGEALGVTRGIAQSIDSVSTAASGGATAVAATRSVASDVAEMGAQLRGVVEKFRI